MSAHCNECGTDLVYGHGEDWQLMTCPVCTVRESHERLRSALAAIVENAECSIGLKAVSKHGDTFCAYHVARAALDTSDPQGSLPDSDSASEGGPNE